MDIAEVFREQVSPDGTVKKIGKASKTGSNGRKPSKVKAKA
jgi:hypothetical protein